MDFIGVFLISNGFDSILVVVDRFSKMTHLIPCLKTLNAEGLCDLAVHNVVRYHGLPDSVVSDRGPQFVSEFLNSILRLFGVRRSLTVGAHPEGNGQSERMNQNLLQYLTCYVNYLQDDWSNLLSYAEFAINNVVNSSTGKSLFEINYGFNPRMNYLNTTDGVKLEPVNSWVIN
jgi:transposase InsO family protein